MNPLNTMAIKNIFKPDADGLEDPRMSDSPLKEKEQFERLYREHAPYAFRAAGLITGSSQYAADAVQEAFVRVYMNLDKYDPDRPFKPWFYKILINECNRIMAKHKQTLYIQDYEDTAFIAPVPDNTGKNFEYEDVLKAMTRLDEKIRTPLILKYVHSFTAQEISEIMNINVNTIKSRLNFGREKLRTLLMPSGIAKNVEEQY